MSTMGNQSSLTQPAYLGAPSTYAPSTVSATPLNQQLLNSITPNATIQQIQQAYLPQEMQATQNLNQTLADFGVGGGQAIQANQQLQGELASSIAPALASAIQGAQGLQVGANEFNSGQGLNAAIQNANATNAAGQYGATATNNTNAANTGQYNQTQEQLLQDLLAQYMSEQGTAAGIIGGGQSAGNQNAVNYGETITTQDPFATIFGGLSSLAGAFI